MKNCFLLCLAIAIALQLQAQSLVNFPYYSIAHNNGTNNTLFNFNYSTNKWIAIGETGTDNIKAIAADQINNVMYAVDGDRFGKIDVQTGLFISINSIGIGNGDFGEIILNNIEGLTYDSVNEIIFATHRIESGALCESIGSSNDLLFQINATTGQLITGAMLDGSGNAADYAVIENVSISTMLDVCDSNETLNDVNDIAFNPYTGALYAIQNQKEVCAVTIIDPADGTIESLMYDLEEMDVVSLSFSPFGELFCTTGDEAKNHTANCFKLIDLQNMGTYDLSLPDPTGAHHDFRGMDFLSARNDLALTLDLDSSVSEPVNVGDNVTFLITLYNQGAIDNVDIVVTNYIPDGLTLTDANWAAVPGTNAAEFIFAGPLLSNTNTTIPVSFTVDENFTGNLIRNYAEISHSYNPDIVDANGDWLPLPDFDSQPDANNDELMFGAPIVDNMINERGPAENEDEDDHDVATVTLQNIQASGNLLCETTVEPAACNGLGSAKIEILDDAVAPFTHKWLDDDGALFRLEVTDNAVHQMNSLAAGTYYASITDASNKAASFAVTVSTLATDSGNSSCNNCPENLVTPANLLNGTFKAKNTIEINGYIDGSESAEFIMCE